MSDDPLGTTRSIADATKSVSDTTRKGIEVSEKAGKFFARILGEDASGILQDVMFYFRAKNAVALQDKLDAILQNRQIHSPESIPLRLAIPFLDAATLENDDTIQERWARLLANALDPSYTVAIERYVGQILESLAPQDCLALEFMHAVSAEDSEIELTPEVVAEGLGGNVDQTLVSLGNLIRVGVIARKPKSGEGIGFIATWLFPNSAFYVTELGDAFLRACGERD